MIKIISPGLILGDRKWANWYPVRWSKTHADVKKLYTGVKNFDSRGKQSLQRSEKNTIERYNNVIKPNKKDRDELDYYADLLAAKLGDNKSLTYYKIACRRFNPQKLIEKAAEIISDGGARNPGAVFTDWLKQQ